MHAMCYARLALRVRDLARVEGLVVGQVRWGVAVVWQRQSAAWPAGRVSMKDGGLRACMHAVCPTRGVQRVRDLSRVVGGLWGVAQTRMLGVQAVRQAQFLDCGHAS